MFIAMWSQFIIYSVLLKNCYVTHESYKTTRSYHTSDTKTKNQRLHNPENTKQSTMAGIAETWLSEASTYTSVATLDEDTATTVTNNIPSPAIKDKSFPAQ